MAQWHDSVISYLEKKDYEKIASFYEEKINYNANDITNYWYLGLTYLLMGQEEEAESIWLMPFFELNEQEILLAQKKLIEILNQEIERQNQEKNQELVWLLRQKIRELTPDNLNNLLHLLILSSQLNRFREGDIHEWNVINLVRNSDINTLDSSLVEKVLNRILNYPLVESIELAQVILAKAKNKQTIFNLIAQKANNLGYYHKYFTYAIDLLTLCLKYESKNLDWLHHIFWFNAKREDYQQCEKTAHIFAQYSATIPQKAIANYYLLHTFINQGNWLKIKKILPEYETLLKQLAQESTKIDESFISESFISLGRILLYLKDDPKPKRKLLNTLAYCFQNLCQSNYDFSPQNFPIDKQISRKKIKIGYIGHTLRSHSVGWLSRWLIKYHNRQKFSIYIYLINQDEDEITNQYFRQDVEQVVNLQSDVITVAKKIKQDEIDILIDLDSLTLNFTVAVMALKPALIQATWLGMDATGIPNIDYFIADPYVLPEDADEYYQEKIWRLPDTYLGIDGFEIDVPTLKREDLDIPDDAVVYLNIQNTLKRHPDIIHQQMKIIKAVPNSYFLIKGNGDRNILQNYYNSIAKEEGVSPDRLRFLEQTPTSQIHRANLTIADIILDTYPYNGATTTLETLWMEIPIVTRVGEQFAARNSYTFMLNAGISEGIAWSNEEYVNWGIKLGQNEKLRQQISWKLKKSKQTSPLWNGKKFTQKMEKAYQQMWNIYQENIINTNG